LYALARERQAPAIFARKTFFNLPFWSLGVSALTALFAYFSLGKTATVWTGKVKLMTPDSLFSGTADSAVRPNSLGNHMPCIPTFPSRNAKTIQTRVATKSGFEIPARDSHLWFDRHLVSEYEPLIQGS